MGGFFVRYIKKTGSPSGLPAPWARWADAGLLAGVLRTDRRRGQIREPAVQRLDRLDEHVPVRLGQDRLVAARVHDRDGVPADVVAGTVHRDVAKLAVGGDEAGLV